jgi:hypothetical protein
MDKDNNQQNNENDNDFFMHCMKLIRETKKIEKNTMNKLINNMEKLSDKNKSTLIAELILAYNYGLRYYQPDENN